MESCGTAWPDDSPRWFFLYPLHSQFGERRPLGGKRDTEPMPHTSPEHCEKPGTAEPGTGRTSPKKSTSGVGDGATLEEGVGAVEGGEMGPTLGGLGLGCFRSEAPNGC